MRNLKITLVVAALLVAAQGCAIFGGAGRETREHVLLPAIEQAWPAVEVELIDGINYSQVAGELSPEGAANYLMRAAEWTAELEDPSVADMIALSARDWAEFEFYALRDIAVRQSTGEIGPMVAELLRERVTQLDDALSALSGEPTEPE